MPIVIPAKLFCDGKDCKTPPVPIELHRETRGDGLPTSPSMQLTDALIGGMFGGPPLDTVVVDAKLLEGWFFGKTEDRRRFGLCPDCVKKNGIST
jgi:hypothetical protein